ncbi:4a-hydroxytetrahydrobiopterin dehydratase [Moraxella sp. FZFQ2102]|uniref:4a-hydroxytetrahydrobiopterin dehydratase n=1 Tax=Moraxella sp. FZFQ2102 TaxID=2953752 RepID=UPI00209BDD14|nr:4a-hydroxytetrahydrobiopterin dehydratase [Moraxella sp. FZFQ2102]USZ15190.1 4a-hydroxytetrahydrobiopterin dehydratase [Moraxella sp. FZFQ2102]
MTTPLKDQACEVCRLDAPLVCDDQLPSLLKQIPTWQMVTINDVKRLTKVFKFKNFKQALAFANRVGDIGETAGHHPALLVEWGKVTVSWWSHEAGGLHKNDFILAARTDDAVDS